MKPAHELLPPLEDTSELVVKADGPGRWRAGALLIQVVNGLAVVKHVHPLSAREAECLATAPRLAALEIERRRGGA